MGGRAGGGARGGGRNPYRSAYDSAYKGQIAAINEAISTVTSGGKYASHAANFLKTEVLGDANPATVKAAKQLIKSNHFYHPTPNESRIVTNGGYAAAALKMKSKITKALNGK